MGVEAGDEANAFVGDRAIITSLSHIFKSLALLITCSYQHLTSDRLGGNTFTQNLIAWDTGQETCGIRFKTHVNHRVNTDTGISYHLSLRSLINFTIIYFHD